MKLADIMNTQSAASGSVIAELIIQEGNAEMIKLITDEVELIQLHYEKEDDTYRGYFHCLGQGCPFCKAMLKPTSYVLMPVFSVSQSKVGALRVSNARGPHRLLPMIARFLSDPEISQKILTISRDKSNRYTVDQSSKPEYAAVGAEEVADFVEQVKRAAIDIRSVFPTHTAEELRSIPAIRRKLNVCEGKPVNEGIES